MTPEEIEKEKERLRAIIAVEKPHAKPGSRNRIWQNNRERALERLHQIESGNFPPEPNDWEIYG